MSSRTHYDFSPARWCNKYIYILGMYKWLLLEYLIYIAKTKNWLK